MAKNRSGFTPFNKARATGSSSRYGGAAGAGSRRVLNPWGNAVPAAQGRRANALGVTIARGRPSGSAARRPTPSPQLWGMQYTPNDPNAWPIQGGKQGPASGMTQHKIDWNNSVVTKAYQRAGYAG